MVAVGAAVGVEVKAAAGAYSSHCSSSRTSARKPARLHHAWTTGRQQHGGETCVVVGFGGEKGKGQKATEKLSSTSLCPSDLSSTSLLQNQVSSSDQIATNLSEGYRLLARRAKSFRTHDVGPRGRPLLLGRRRRDRDLVRDSLLK